MSVELAVRTVVLRERPRDVARYLCDVLPRLGPTYVKIGQFMSSRHDIFGEECAEGLRDLQDNVARLEFEQVRDMILRTTLLRSSLDTIDTEPIASASIAQIHRGQLLDGREIVVKVKRPGIDATLQSDLSLIRVAVQLMAWAGVHQARYAKDMLEDFVAMMAEELDFDGEVRNIQAFARLYRGRADVVVPRVYDLLSDQNIIVMEYVPSMRVLEYAGDRVMLSYRLMAVFLGQVMYRGGLIHGDPQPGNLGIAQDGRIVLYDYGSSIRMSEKYRTRLKMMMYSIITQDDASALAALRSMGVEILDVELALQYMRMYARYVRSMDFRVFEVQQKDMPFALTNTLLRLVRVFGTLEGVCKRLNADFDYADMAAMTWDAFLLDTEFITAKGRVDLTVVMQSFSLSSHVDNTHADDDPMHATSFGGWRDDDDDAY